MQDQQRTNLPEGEWASCKSVTLRDGVLHCSLELNRTYVLTEAYENDLHIRFANANSDQDLIAFVRAWGPLYIPNWQIPSDGTVSLSLAHCRAYQRWIKALLDVLAAFKWAVGEREALEEFIEAEYGVQQFFSPDEPVLFTLLRNAFSFTGNVPDWVKGANLRAVRAAADYLVSLVPVHPSLVKLTCRRKGKRRHVEAGWTFLSLEEALRWMIWYDEFTKHPVVCCPECRKVFRGETTRVRKYCSEKCGHKATARVSMQKKRAAEPKERK